MVGQGDSLHAASWRYTKQVSMLDSWQVPAGLLHPNRLVAGTAWLVLPTHPRPACSYVECDVNQRTAPGAWWTHPAQDVLCPISGGKVRPTAGLPAISAR